MAVGVDVSQACFALFLLQLQLFTPRVLLLHSFPISQDSIISNALVSNYTEMFIKQHSTIFNLLSTLAHYNFCSSKVMVLKLSPDLRSYDKLNVLLFI